MTCPWSSTATHSLTDGHATPASWPVATSTGVLQMTVRAAGLVVIVMRVRTWRHRAALTRTKGQECRFGQC